MARLILPLLVGLVILTGCNRNETPGTDAAAEAKAARARDIAARMERREIQTRPVTWTVPAEAIPDRLTQEQKAQYAWRLKTTVGAYKTMGSQNPKWDEPALRMLTNFAQFMDGFEKSAALLEQSHANGSAALAAGCDDPLVKYVTAWFGDNIADGRAKVSDFVEAANGMKGTVYPPIRRFFASQRGVDAIKFEIGQTNTPVVWEMRLDALNFLHAALEDPEIPANEALSAFVVFLQPVEKVRQFSLPAFDRLEPVLTNRWPDHHMTWHWVGRMNVGRAWEARGSGWADTVKEEGWKVFSERLSAAAEALERSWRITPIPETAVEMITVETGQGQGRERMELWFSRAMELDKSNYTAANRKLLYLMPKWHGSDEEMLAFGRECVNSSEWGGRVPFILWNAHYEIDREQARNGSKENYWAKPGVWEDVRASFEKFFKIHDEHGWRHDYALYAHKCGQPAAFLEQVERMGPVNYKFFGGEAAFNAMVAEARRAVGRQAPPSKP